MAKSIASGLRSRGTSRIEGLTKQVGADILVSATTARGLDGDVALDALPAVRVKGRSAEVEVFRVV